MEKKKKETPVPAKNDAAVSDEELEGVSGGFGFDEPRGFSRIENSDGKPKISPPQER